MKYATFLFVGLSIFLFAPTKLTLAETILKERAIASFEGAGFVFQIADGVGYFVGALRGTMFSDAKDDALQQQIDIVCPVSITVGIDTGTSNGEGHCIFQMSENDDLLYTKFTCTGDYGKGCSGPMEITGGAGRFRGATGAATITSRDTLHRLMPTAIKVQAAQAATGYLEFSNIEITTPE